MSKINICIVGGIYDTSGYSSHTRSLSNAIYKKLYEEYGDDFTMRLECALPQDWLRLSNDEEVKMIQTPYNKDMTVIFIGQPQFSNAVLSKNPKNFIQFVVWESDVIPAGWVKYLENPKCVQVWVPSEFVKQAVINRKSSLKDKIVVVPHGVDFSLFGPVEKEKPVPISDEANKEPPFIFFYNKGWSQGVWDRGGMQFLIQAFSEEFTDKDNVELRLKINPCYALQGWDLADEIKKLGLKKSECPKVSVCMDSVSQDELKFYYGQADVFVAPTMGEGFGLTMAESMACGVPVVTTSFGGQTDFVSAENGWLLPFDLVEVPDMMYEGSKLARVKVSELRRVMRELYNDRVVVKQKKDLALKDIQAWGWSVSAGCAVKALKKVFVN